MHQWELQFHHIMNELLDCEAPKDSDKLCSTCQSPAIYYCIDCNTPLLRCIKCIVSEHIANPFHQIQRWDNARGAYDKNVSLKSLGLAIHLGHEGHPCPKGGIPSELSVVHTNGISSVSVCYCSCETKIHQLLRHKLFPGTINRIRTVFTFQALRQFHLFHLQCRVPSLDWCCAISRLTNNSKPVNTPSFYKLFVIVSRQWRKIKTYRRSGETLIRSDLGQRCDVGSCAVQCAACPCPENMPNDWDIHHHKLLSFLK
jgi:hypothetical protein